ncbi:Pkinase domain-containing protein/WAK_assoc domain-containing protein [Cephalotus follicularis]|uniref:non-specific serine/threonine protein kinase n=1 Tax=Cephalotus follicularis TaxID=3775 RepID=A0A1Q3CWJ7_CEPFO|nr:Pkinase domain-containing protein/WAK_assoc domain-containing protein [Cephalotus follicularis]
MDLQTTLKSKRPLHHICIMFIIFTTLDNQTQSLHPKFETCVPRTCGEGPSISYPFWINGEQDSFCGYPNFQISCNGNNPVLNISSDEYVIKDIFPGNFSLRLANAAVYEDTCATPLHNISLDRTPFSLSPTHTDFLFLYNCTEKPEENSTYPVNCASNATHYSFAAFDLKALESTNYSFKSCQSLVDVPMDVIVDLLGMSYTDVLRMGFLLNWTAPNCSSCKTSGGRCGSDNNDFICFCQDRPHLQTCDDGDKTDWRKKLSIGLAAGLGGVLLSCIIFFIYLRRSKKLHARSTLLSRDFSSNPSSKIDPENGETLFGAHLFTYSELELATNNFDPNNELGDGGFGTVYYGELQDGRAIAVKRLFENNYKRVEQFDNEVEILTRLRHPNLVLLYGCTSRTSRELLLVYEYISNGTVADHLHGELSKPGSLSWPIRMKIAVETASALAYLHASDIIHRDVKTNNILLDKHFCVKVADFGLSRLYPTHVTHVSTAPQGTPGYVDPEYHQCYQLTDRSDVFSFGVVLIELISSKPAVDITRHRHEINLSTMAINKIQNRALFELVDQTLGFESDYKVRRMITAVAELAFRCLQNEKEMRPSMEQVSEVLKGIESEENNIGKAEEIDIPSDDSSLLKSGQLTLSPDSVNGKYG